MWSDGANHHNTNPWLIYSVLYTANKKNHFFPLGLKVQHPQTQAVPLLNKTDLLPPILRKTVKTIWLKIHPIKDVQVPPGLESPPLEVLSGLGFGSAVGSHPDWSLVTLSR